MKSNGKLPVNSLVLELKLGIFLSLEISVMTHVVKEVLHGYNILKQSELQV